MKNKKSFFTLILLFIVIVLVRLNAVSENELTWDVFGYYLYLPATFIHHDFMLTDISWIHDVMKTHEISGTLYQLSRGPDGNTMYFFLMGMSILYSPFFFIGHIIAYLTDSPMDGFSEPYHTPLQLVH